MQNMMSMMNNPEMMKQINTMMQTPEIQNMLKDPSLMNNILGMMNNSQTSNTNENDSNTESNNESININLNNEDSHSDSDDEIQDNQNLEETDNGYEIGERVNIVNLSNNTYNNQIGRVTKYISDTNRYCITLESSDKVLSIKPSNLEKIIDLE